MTEEEARVFWDTHEVTEEYRQKAEPAPEGDVPYALPANTHRGALRIAVGKSMNSKRVSVAEGKKAFTQLLKEAQEKQMPILIFNKRLGQLAGAILPPEELTIVTLDDIIALR